MNSKPKIPCIPIEGSISYEDWLKGRRYRRELGNRVAPEIIRRKKSSSDRRLKKLFNGERGLPFTPTEKLQPKEALRGAGNLEHMADVLLEGKADAVLAASIFHFGTYTVDVKKFLAEKTIPVRL